MSQFIYKKPDIFSTRKVSVDQAIRLLHRNGIQVNREKAELILDFLYLVAKTYHTQKRKDDCLELEPEE
ncbi:hypothetical protein [Chitinophaga sp.]|uniref:hypothetical protein n=1 Tax=Chitinophaga sp. TaxID=1869181 RepID=UPI002F932256